MFYILKNMFYNEEINIKYFTKEFFIFFKIYIVINQYEEMRYGYE